MRCCGLKHDSNLVRSVGAEWLLPQCNRAVDAPFALVLKTSLRFPHRRRKDGQQYVAIVRFAERVLQRCEPLRG